MSAWFVRRKRCQVECYHYAMMDKKKRILFHRSWPSRARKCWWRLYIVQKAYAGVVLVSLECREKRDWWCSNGYFHSLWRCPCWRLFFSSWVFCLFYFHCFLSQWNLLINHNVFLCLFYFPFFLLKKTTKQKHSNHVCIYSTKPSICKLACSALRIKAFFFKHHSVCVCVCVGERERVGGVEWKSCNKSIWKKLGCVSTSCNFQSS